jgi:hypothetical protein
MCDGYFTTTRSSILIQGTARLRLSLSLALSRAPRSQNHMYIETLYYIASAYHYCTQSMLSGNENSANENTATFSQIFSSQILAYHYCTQSKLSGNENSANENTATFSQIFRSQIFCSQSTH